MTSNIFNVLGASINYSVSKNGVLCLILNRFMYTAEYRYSDGRRKWRCSNRNLKCKAFVVTQDDVVVKRVYNHIHSYHDKKILRLVAAGNVFNKLPKEDSLSTGKKAKNPYAQRKKKTVAETAFDQNNKNTVAETPFDQSNKNTVVKIPCEQGKLTPVVEQHKQWKLSDMIDEVCEQMNQSAQIFFNEHEKQSVEADRPYGQSIHGTIMKSPYEVGVKTIATNQGSEIHKTFGLGTMHITETQRPSGLRKSGADNETHRAYKHKKNKAESRSSIKPKMHSERKKSTKVKGRGEIEKKQF